MAKGILPGVENSMKPTLSLGSVKDSENQHRAKMENGDGKASSAPEAKISPTQYPGKSKGK